MQLSWRKLFRGRRRHRATHGCARSGNAARLHVEALEGHDVPAVMNLTCYTFALPGATLPGQRLREGSRRLGYRAITDSRGC
jgi:hypothetical protein